MTLSKACAVVACLFFVLAALSVSLGSVPLLPVGLAFLAAAHFVD